MRVAGNHGFADGHGNGEGHNCFHFSFVAKKVTATSARRPYPGAFAGSNGAIDSVTMYSWTNAVWIWTGGAFMGEAFVLVYGQCPFSAAAAGDSRAPELTATGDGRVPALCARMFQ